MTVTARHLATSLLLMTLHASGDWRGDGSGVYPDADPPLTWRVPGTGVEWTVPLPSWGNAGPSIAGDRLFLGAEPHLLLCLDARDGSLLWKREHPGHILMTPEQRTQLQATQFQRENHRRIKAELDKTHAKLKREPNSQYLNTRAAELAESLEAIKAEMVELPEFPSFSGHVDTGGSSPTPVVDPAGKRVFALFASGIVVAYDFEGQRLWLRALPMAPVERGHTSSPVLAHRRLIVCHGPVSALDPDTGDTVWTVESDVRHGTPVVTTIRDRNVVITPAGQCLRTSDGAAICDNLPSPPFSSPIVHDGVVYVVGAGPDGDRATAYALPTQTRKRQPATKLWETPLKKGRYFASPVLHNGLLFGCRQSGTVYAIDAKSGAIRKQRAFSQMHPRFGQCYASLALGGQHLYVTSDNGTILVLAPDATLKLLAENKLSKVRANLLIDGQRLYARGVTHLYCIRGSAD